MNMQYDWDLADLVGIMEYSEMFLTATNCFLKIVKSLAK